MTDRLRIATAQLNPTVGDLGANAALIGDAYAKATEAGADLLVTPELSITGYPPEDLLLKPAFVDDAMKAVERLAGLTGAGGPAIIVGAPWRDTMRGGVFNAALLLDQGRILARREKHALPNYGVFDEKRVFVAGPVPEPVTWRGVKIGLPICEDIWFEAAPLALIREGAELLICINASPWRRHINAQRANAFIRWIGAGAPPLIFVNQVGGQDELVFDGASFSWQSAPTGLEEVQRLAAFAPDFDVADWMRVCESDSTDDEAGWRCVSARREEPLLGEEAVYRAATLAIGDYVNKNGFPGVVIGLSGGVDSALTAALAVDALGPDRVWCVMLPSRYTSAESLEDARACAAALGVRLDTVAIEPAVEAFGAMLAEAFTGKDPDTTEENLQSRIRGATLMALSNKFGHMVLTTGNKSEMAVGYATLYGDMNGGYNALKDLYKTEVYALCAWRNAHHGQGLKGPAGPVIPARILTKAPTAELAPGQTDQDSLPPYAALDDILAGLVDRDEEVEAVIARGHDPAVVHRVQNLLYRAEYKRRQAAPGAKIGVKNFGRDRRYPITNTYRDEVGE